MTEEMIRRVVSLSRDVKEYLDTQPNFNLSRFFVESWVAERAKDHHNWPVGRRQGGADLHVTTITVPPHISQEIDEFKQRAPEVNISLWLEQQLRSSQPGLRIPA